MIQVESIRVQEFRGIRDLTIDFKSKNFAVCGPNGTGKSGIVDALEFGLTGNISRLSGKGMGDVSVKDHAPHVDSRNHPDKCLVTVTVSIPKLGKSATIERSVKNPQKPKITPADADILAALEQVARHPEFALSRRELIRYVISTPGDRATEVQALLRLDDIGKLRAILQKLSNAAAKVVEPLRGERSQARSQLLQALGVSSASEETILPAVNERRALLGLGPIPALSSTTSFRDGIVAGPTGAALARVPKAQAVVEVKSLRDVLARLNDAELRATTDAALAALVELSSDPAASASATKEAFLEAAITQLVDEKCPVCDTPWKLDELQRLIEDKLKSFEDAAKKREEIEQKMAPLISLLAELGVALSMVQPYGPLLDPAIDVTALGDFRKSLSDRRTQLEAFLPLVSTIEAAKGVATIPATVVATINSLDAAVALLPEPTKQDAAREFLIIGQERLETYRGVASRTKQAEDYATLTATVYDTYADVSTKALEAIYKKVEKEFADLYSHINKDDEEKFTAQLTPSFGKLGFDVDFYGRGFFPPGAYHSEGHQDGMGLCLYLALMRHLLQDDFRFAVLDDVVMSVDSGHRRQVCNLLKEKFPNTQFILTTHDEIWLRHMRSAGLISSKSFVQFKNWNVEEGPTEWTDRDVWQEIEQALKSNDVRRAAGILRHYLEYISAEICDRLRAPVEFRGDAQFQLGDLLPSAVGQFGKLLREGKAAAQSWGQKDKMVTLTTLESDFKKSVEGSKVEQWQVNTAIHYNQWENLQKADFEPVVLAYRALLGHFRCAEATCGALLAVVPERNQRETVRCPCGANDINLVPKS